MHSAAVRPYFNAGVALVGASVIAVAPLAPAPPHISLPTIRSAEVALTAAVSPLDAYAQLLHNTLLNVGTLTHQTFVNGVAPLLSQFVVNQLTLVQGLGGATQQALTGLPPLLEKVVSELAALQVQAATETIGTGLVQTALPFLTPLTQPLNALVRVVDVLPNVVLLGSLAVIQPPLAALESTGQAVQGVIDSLTKLDLVGVVNAAVAAPAVILNGVLNGYTPTQTAGLLTPGLGTLSILVNIRDMIVNALKPPVVAATSAVTTTKTAAAKVVTLDVAPALGTTTTKATDPASSATDSTAAEGKTTAAKDAGTAAKDAGTAAKDETAGKTTTAGTSTKGDTATKGDTSTTGDTATKDDSSSAPSSSTSTSKTDSDSSKASDTKKDAKKGTGTAKASHGKASKKK